MQGAQNISSYACPFLSYTRIDQRPRGKLEATLLLSTLSWNQSRKGEYVPQ